MSPARRSGADQTRFTRLAETAGPRILATSPVGPPRDAATCWRVPRLAAAVADRADEVRRWLAVRIAGERRQPPSRGGPACVETAACHRATANAKRHRRLTRSSPSAMRSAAALIRELLTPGAGTVRADQAAAILNISAAAARQRLVRARRRLRAELDTGPDATTVNDGPPTFTPTDTWPRSAFKR